MSDVEGAEHQEDGSAHAPQSYDSREQQAAKPADKIHAPRSPASHSQRSSDVQSHQPSSRGFKGSRIWTSNPVSPSVPQIFPDTRFIPYTGGQIPSPTYGPLLGSTSGAPALVGHQLSPFQPIPNMQWHMTPMPYLPQMYVPQQLYQQDPAYFRAWMGAYPAPGSHEAPRDFYQRGHTTPLRAQNAPPGPESPDEQRAFVLPVHRSRPEGHRGSSVTQRAQPSSSRQIQRDDKQTYGKGSPSTINPAPRSNETTTSNTIHSIPRGPPRKPKQSVFALWVGNIPPRTDILALKDHFSKDATNDIESVFLISKSNCAFVNYRTEESSKAALTRLHGVRFNGARLVCRLRQTEDSTATEEMLTGNPTGERQDSHVGLTVQEKYSVGGDAIDEVLSSGDKDLSDNPTSSANSTDSLNIQRPTCQSANEPSFAKTHRGEDANKGSDRYFIMKSLTSEDLDTSVREGTWTTQSHNEKTLNEAYQHVRTVMLIFSANKSGEYYGYARMASTVDRTLAQPRVVRSVDEQADEKVSKPTPATASAPKGRVVEDTSRGTIFWEAEIPSQAERGSHEGCNGESSKTRIMDTGQEHEWGNPFRVEWLCTTPLPFYKLRGLRNPWNSNREVKIARDGTELEPSVGRTLVDMFESSVGAEATAPTGLLVSSHA